MQDITEEMSSQKGELFIRASDFKRWCQYQPWFLRISTLQKRWLFLLLLVPLVVLIVILVICLSPGSQTGGPAGAICVSEPALYRGEYSSTLSGLTCQHWSRLNMSVHSIHPHRYSEAGLGDHNYCRDPDGTGRLWCYTSLTADHFDYCTAKQCGPEGEARGGLRSETEDSPGLDTSCLPEVSALNQGAQVDGTYRMSDKWVNGRGVYKKITRSAGLPSAVCLSWHAQYRHWWFNLCTNAGTNGGFGWLEEDGKCPYDGIRWRAGGSDELREGATVVPIREGVENCVENAKRYEGVAVGTGSRAAGDPASCRQYCFQAQACRAFSFNSRDNRCRLFHAILNKTVDPDYVSGSHTCQRKVKVGCPRDSVRIKGGCFRFLDSIGHICEEGCSRFRAMEECELTGGFLADSLSEDVLRDLLKKSYSTHSYSSWWLAASDFRKMQKFTWERSGDPVPSTSDLWHEVTAQESLSANLTTTDSSSSSATSRRAAAAAASAVQSADPSVPRGSAKAHSCVYMARFSGEMKLSQVNCDTALARPLCQFLVQ